MDNYESDYSEDFEEEELVSSGAAPSSKPSASLARRQHQSHHQQQQQHQQQKQQQQQQQQQRQLREAGEEGGGGGGRGVEKRVEGVVRPREDEYGTPSRRKVPATISKSTGAGRRALARDARLSRRTHTFLPPKFQLLQKGSKFAGSSPMRDRQLSAKNHTICHLQNKLSEKEKRFEEMSRENRLLNRMQRRQDKEWSRIQQQEDELPQILQRHSEEVKALRKQLKKSQEEVVATQRRSRELQDEIRRLSETTRRLEKLVERKRLLERDQLTEQLQLTRQQLEGREKRVTELERGLEASVKTHAQEVKGLRLRNRALATEREALRDSTTKLHSQLKEKTKEMDILNIYTQRLPRSTAKPPPPPSHSIPTEPPSPPPPPVANQASQTTLSCPPFKTVSLQHRSQLKAASSQTDLVRGTELGKVARQNASISTQTTESETTSPVVVVSETKAAAEPAGVAVVGQMKAKEKNLPGRNVVENPQALESSGEQAQMPVHGDSTQTGGKIEADRSKQLLIQRLRELDSQKTAPGSDPVPPVQTGGSATTVSTATAQPHPSGATTCTAEASSVSQTETATRERERKQLLLAKLMAIDDRNDPNYANMTPKSSQNQPPPVEARVPGISSEHGTSRNMETGSSSSISSWPEVVENMHQGRPAHASEDDPFGSKTRLSSLKKTATGKGRSAGGGAVDTGAAVRGRGGLGGRGRHTFVTEQPEPPGGVLGGGARRGPGGGSGGESKLHPEPVTEEAGAGYKPSYGRRATNAIANTSRPSSESRTDPPSLLPGSAGKTIHTDPTPSWQQSLDQEGKQSPAPPAFGGDARSGGVLPQRPKAPEPAAMKSYDVMPGAEVSEPDDLEELVL